MSDDIIMTGASLSDFLARIELPQAARDRVIEIDRKLADALASDDPDANGCADLVLEAADLIADANPPVFDWKGWDADDDEPGDDDGFEFDAIEWGEE